jgi:hypothetical protein
LSKQDKDSSSSPPPAAAFGSSHSLPSAAALPPDRCVRVAGSVAAIKTIIDDQRNNWSAFLEEDHGDFGKEARAEIESLFKLYPAE